MAGFARAPPLARTLMRLPRPARAAAALACTAAAAAATTAGASRARPGRRELRCEGPWVALREAPAAASLPANPTVYELGATLGSGGFATVKQATHRWTGEVFALKLVSKAKTPPQLHENEVRVLRAIGEHRHIATLKDHVDMDHAWGLVLRLAAGGEVFERVCQRGRYSEQTAAAVVRQVAEALRHVHGRGIVHRDLKPENLLLASQEGHDDVLLCDFGMARFVGLGAPPLIGRAGTLAYMAPEMLCTKPYGPQVDVWALGVIMFILLSGTHPFNRDCTHDEVLIEHRIVSGHWDFEQDCWKHISEDARELITRMLHPDPAQRLKISELLSSPWIADGQAPSAPLPHSTTEQLSTFNVERRQWRVAIRALAFISCAGAGHESSSMPPAPLDLPQESLEELREAFGAYDFNGTGTIEKDELRHLARRLGLPESAEWSGRDAISFEDFCATVGPIYTHSQTALRRTFELFDEDCSGEIDKSELCRMLGKLSLPGADAEAMFASADADGDGRISFHEYVSVFAE